MPSSSRFAQIFARNFAYSCFVSADVDESDGERTGKFVNDLHRECLCTLIQEIHLPFVGILHDQFMKAFLPEEMLHVSHDVRHREDPDAALRALFDRPCGVLFGHNAFTDHARNGVKIKRSLEIHTDTVIAQPLERIQPEEKLLPDKNSLACVVAHKPTLLKNISAHNNLLNDMVFKNIS